MPDELRGAEEGQPAIAFEVLDCERRWDAVLTASAAGWLHSADVARLDVAEDLAWGCPAQTRVGPMQRVVTQRTIEVSLEFGVGREAHWRTQVEQVCLSVLQKRSSLALA